MWKCAKTAGFAQQVTNTKKLNKKYPTTNFKSLDIPGTILLTQFSYIEQQVGLDCGIEQSGKHWQWIYH